MSGRLPAGGVVRTAYGACVSVPPGALAPDERLAVTIALCDDSPTFEDSASAATNPNPLVGWHAGGPAISFGFETYTAPGAGAQRRLVDRVHLARTIQ